MTTIIGIEREWMEHTHIRVKNMMELHTMDGATPPGMGSPPEMAGGGAMDVPDMPMGGPPPMPADLTAAIYVEDGSLSEKSNKAALWGGEVDEVRGDHVRIQTYAFTVRSHNADITLKNVNIHAGSGVLVHGMVNPDKNATKTGGRQVYGIRVFMEDMDVCGDLIHEDPDRDMRITLKSTQLNGAVKNAWLELDAGSHWTATADSAVTLIGAPEIHQFDAPTDVTITAICHSDEIIDLPSGGRLVLCKPE